MNEELDKTKIEDENNAPAASVSEEAKESPSNDELNESLQNEILEEDAEEAFDNNKLNEASLEEILEEAEKVLVLTPAAALKRFNSIKPIFNEHYNQQKAEAQEAFNASNEDEEVKFEFAKQDLLARFKTVAEEIKKARKEEKERIENEKKKNLKIKEDLLKSLEDLVQKDETSESINDVKAIQKKWKNIRVLPKEKVTELWDKYNSLLDRFYDNHSINIELKELDRKKNLEAKIELTKKVEAIGNEASLKRSFILLNKYHEEFKNIGPVPSESREPIWQAFKAASDAVYEQKRKVFESLEAGKEDNLKKKEILAEKAELLSQKEPSSMKEWNSLHQEFENLFAEWKKIGPIPKSNNDAVWIKFNGLRNDFFGKRKEYFREIHAEKSENLTKKEALCTEVEALKDSTDWNNASKKIIALQKQWKEIGPVPDKVNQAIWKRFRGACDHFFNNKTKAFAGQREEESENLKKKEALITRLEEIFNSDMDYKASFEALKKVSAEWRSVGFVPHKNVKSISSRYEKASNAIFSKYKEQAQQHKTENLKEHYKNLSDTPNGDKTLDYEMRNIKKKMSIAKEEIASIERNMSFFSKSKTAEKMLKDFEQKIVKSKKLISNLKLELAAIKNAKRSAEESSNSNDSEEASPEPSAE